VLVFYRAGRILNIVSPTGRLARYQPITFMKTQGPLGGPHFLYRRSNVRGRDAPEQYVERSEGLASEDSAARCGMMVRALATSNHRT
jgi:hypothetical protein